MNKNLLNETNRLKEIMGLKIVKEGIPGISTLLGVVHDTDVKEGILKTLENRANDGSLNIPLVKRELFVDIVGELDDLMVDENWVNTTLKNSGLTLDELDEMTRAMYLRYTESDKPEDFIALIKGSGAYNEIDWVVFDHIFGTSESDPDNY